MRTGSCAGFCSTGSGPARSTSSTRARPGISACGPTRSAASGGSGGSSPRTSSAAPRSTADVAPNVSYCAVKDQFRREPAMPEAVIVATARSPIGRAFKGTMTSIRPDDLTLQMIKAALAKVPQLDPADIEDLILGSGLPGGEQGYNMARVPAVMPGLDSLPCTTITRSCSSPLPSTRMAYHAIKSGEGDIFISAGVQGVRRVGKGSSDGAPGPKNPRFAAAADQAP